MSIDVKSKREELTYKKAIAEQDKKRSLQAIRTIREIFEKVNQEHVDMLLARGVNVKTLLSYDLDKVYTEPEYQTKFIAEAEKALTELEKFIMSESGA